MTELTFSNKTVNSTFDRSIADSNYTLKSLCYVLCNAYQDSSKVSSQLFTPAKTTFNLVPFATNVVIAKIST